MFACFLKNIVYEFGSDTIQALLYFEKGSFLFTPFHIVCNLWWHHLSVVEWEILNSVFLILLLYHVVLLLTNVHCRFVYYLIKQLKTTVALRLRCPKCLVSNEKQQSSNCWITRHLCSFSRTEFCRTHNFITCFEHCLALASLYRVHVIFAQTSLKVQSMSLAFRSRVQSLLVEFCYFRNTWLRLETSHHFNWVKKTLFWSLNSNFKKIVTVKTVVLKDIRPGLKVEIFIASIFFELTKSLWIALQQT